MNQIILNMTTSELNKLYTENTEFSVLFSGLNKAIKSNDKRNKNKIIGELIDLHGQYVNVKYYDIYKNINKFNKFGKLMVKISETFDVDNINNNPSKSPKVKSLKSIIKSNIKYLFRDILSINAIENSAYIGELFTFEDSDNVYKFLTNFNYNDVIYDDEIICFMTIKDRIKIHNKSVIVDYKHNDYNFNESVNDLGIVTCNITTSINYNGEHRGYIFIYNKVTNSWRTLNIKTKDLLGYTFNNSSRNSVNISNNDLTYNLIRIK